MANNTSEIQKLYIAYFNRPADKAGLDYWNAQMTAGVSLDTVQNSFSSSAEYQTIYTGHTNSQLINLLYVNLFGHDADAPGLAWWLNEMTPTHTGPVQQTIQSIASVLSSGTTPGSADNTAINAKIAAATAFTAAIDTAPEISGYATATSTAGAFASASAWLSNVKDAATLNTALSGVDAALAAAIAANNVAPVAGAATSVVVAENSTAVGTYAATDANGDVLSYTLTGDDAAKFTVSSAGVVAFVTAPNFEAPGSAAGTNAYAINVVASDGTLSSSQAVTVNVNNINEAPVVTAGQAFNVTENAVALTRVGGGSNYLAATDPDGGFPTGWVITGGTGAALFAVDSFSGLLTAVGPFDFDASTGGVASYTLTVTAQDGAPLTSVAQTITINVVDTNDIAPVVDSAATATVAENALTTDTVYQITSTDVDTTNGTTTYILGGTDAAKFAVSATGAVTFVASPNFEAGTGSGATLNDYVITVQAKDGVNTSLPATAVTISVTNIDDNATSAVTDTNVAVNTVAENALAGVVVGVTGLATDADTGATVTYALDAATLAAGQFAVDATTGVVTTTGTTVINYEAATSINVGVIATSSDGSTPTTATFAVAVTDVNEAPTAGALAMTARAGQSTTVYLNQPAKVNVATNNYSEATITTTDVDTSVAFGVTGHKITAVTQPTSGGTVTLASDGLSFVVSSALGLTTPFTFSYTVTDITGTGLATTATVTVTPTLNLGGTAGNDLLVGSSAAEILDGIGGNDTIIGGGGLDTISGGDGNDRITFSDAAAQLNGGADLDTLVVNSDAVAQAFDLSQLSQQNLDVTLSKNSAGVTGTLRYFENIDATLSTNPIILNGTLDGFTDDASGGAAASYAGGDNVATTSIIGSSSGDTLYFTRATGTGIVVNGLAGNDKIIVDNVEGGNHLDEGATAGASGTFNIDGGAGNDTINVWDTTVSQTIQGGLGDDTITMGSGKSSVDGGAGDDTIHGKTAAGTSASAPVTINGGEGNDTINVGSGGFNSVDGGAGNDLITSANASTDTIIGGIGDDTLVGGTGNDNLSDVSGSNVFQFADTTALVAADTVTGGSGTDTLKLTALAGGLTMATYTKVTGIETLDITTTAGTAATTAVGDFAGLTNVTLRENATDNTNSTLTGLNVGASLTLVGSATAGNNDQRFGTIAVAPTTDTAADSLTVTLVGNVAALGTGSNNNVVALTGNDYETLTINSNSSGAALTTTLTNQNVIATITDSDLTTLNLAGASALTIGGLAITPTTSTITSTMTGDLNLTVSGTSAVAFTGGNGKNTLNMGATLLNTDNIIGGTATTDVLTATISGTDATTGAFKISGVETINLDVTGASTVDATAITGASILAFSTGTGGVTVTKLAAGATVGLGVAGATAYTGASNFALADASGTADVLNIKLGVAATQTTGAITTTGIETINITENIVATGAQVVTLTNATAATVNLSGTTTNANAQDYTLASLNAATTKVDASGLVSSGVFTVAGTAVAVAATAGTMTIIGTGGANVLSTSTAANTNYTIGSNFDSTDSVTGGAGTIDVLNATFSAIDATYNATKITNIETINLSSNFAVTVTTAGTATSAGLLDNDVTKITVSGTGAFTAIADPLGTGTGFTTGPGTFDASGSSGKIEITEAAVGFVLGDTFKGGTGTTDVFHVQGSTSTFGAVTVTGFETLEFAGTGGNSSFDMTNVTGVTNLLLTGTMSQTVTNLAAGVQVSLGATAALATNSIADTVADGKTFTIGRVASSITGTADALTVNLNDEAAITSGITVVANGIENLTFNETTAAKSFALLVQDTNATNPVTFTFTGGVAGQTVTLMSGGIQSNVTSIVSTGLDHLVMASGSRVGTSAMTITSGAGDDTIIMANAADSLTGGTGTDTLNILGTTLSGQNMTVDLSSTTDQVTSYKSVANAAVQVGFENVSGAGITGGGGMDITGSSTANTITGSVNADIIVGGEGADVITGGGGSDAISLTETTGVADRVNFELATASNVASVTGFSVTNDLIGIKETAFSAMNFATAATGQVAAAGDYNEIAGGGALAANKVNVITTAAGYADYATAFAAVTAGGAGSDMIVMFYNSTSGKTEIMWDNDGSDATAVLIGQIDITGANVVNLAATNFYLY